MTLIEQLRAHAKTEPGPFRPFWVNEAKTLLDWAADVIEAGDLVIKECRDSEAAVLERVKP